jgi:ubiquinone/menaquinone biosynthesis C-methylase UbiE
MASPHLGAGAALDPQAIQQMWFSYAPSCVLSAAVQLDVFSHVAAGNGTAAEVARAAGATERGTRMLLDALAGLELVSKRDDRYELRPLAAEYLVRDRPNYMGAVLETTYLMDSWSRLADIIRSGSAPHRLERQQEAEQFFPRLVRSLHVMHREQARRLAAALGAGTTRQGPHVLDVACGSGVWGIAIAEADPRARVTAHDFPVVLETTREYLRRHDVERQFDLVPGDLKEADFGESRFDLAVLGHVLHSEGEASSRALLRRIARALKPGGRVAILEMVPNDERTGPPFPLLFALNMLVHTTEGGTFTLSEYMDWLKEAGFNTVETVEIGGSSPAIIAGKP